MGKFIIAQYKFSDGLDDLRILDAEKSDDKVISIEDGVSHERGLLKDFKLINKSFLVFESIEIDVISLAVFCDEDSVVGAMNYIESRIDDFYNRYLLRVESVHKDIHNYLEEFKEEYR